MAEYDPEAHAAFQQAREEEEYRLRFGDPASVLDADAEIPLNLDPDDFEDTAVDVLALWDDLDKRGWPQKTPTVGDVPGYGPLLYSGLSSVAGASGHAKSKLGQLLIAQTLSEVDGVAVTLDSETGDAPGLYLNQMRLAGVTRQTLGGFVLIDWQTGAVPTELLRSRLRGRQAGLIVADSVPEAMAALNLDENSSRDVARFQKGLKRNIVSVNGSEGAILTIDGLPKGWSPGQDARGGVGSGRKLYGVEMFLRIYRKIVGTVAQPGLSELVCTKDRHGNHAEGATIAELHYGPEGTFFKAMNPKDAAKSKRQREETRSKVLEHLVKAKAFEERPDNPTYADLEAEAVAGPGARDAVLQLIAEGLLGKHEIPSGGRGRGRFGFYLASKVEED
ncbi:hypothetical protein [Microbacterium sp. PRC9]|uniref:hypothetical protein n=1 Tax=Microbacterium sp. PRC9 TaxID=2962591 RepID=UPI0028821EA8|nr:hypothetical protein [Microbacterium sp. PRC9]MDT0143080.1 hypothetical protein [Microbacterium sp. PRC9]